MANNKNNDKKIYINLKKLNKNKYSVGEWEGKSRNQSETESESKYRVD
jgi:hypothetical protein